MICRCRAGLLVLVASASLAMGRSPAAADDGRRPEPGANPTDREAVQDIMFLTDARPIFIRLRLGAGGKAFRSAWIDAVKAIHTYLDRDGDGTLTRKRQIVALCPIWCDPPRAARRRCRVPTSTPTRKTARSPWKNWPMSCAPPSAHSAYRSAAWRSIATMPSSTTSTATRTAHSPRTSSPRPSRRSTASISDDNELIDPNELEPFSNPIAALNQDQTRRGKYAPVPAVIELSSDDPSFRPVRLLLKKYDKGTSDSVRRRR